MKRLALLALPSWLRRPLAGALIYAGVAPLGRLLGELRAYRSATSYRLGHNGQVCKLRGVLNDELDPELRRVRIADGGEEALEGVRVWVRSEERWVGVPRREKGGGCMVNGRGYGGISGVDFVVVLPMDVRGKVDETRVRGIVNMYRLAGKRYAIGYEQ